MRIELVLCAAAAAITFGAFAPDASARPFRPNLLPNGGANSCSNCHVSAGGGGTRTLFGEDVRDNVTVGGMEFFWPDVCNLDSDGDGQTNGEELGDPCCVWDNTADPDRASDIALPGDETSTSADPNGPDDDGDGISNSCDPDYVPPEDMGSSGEDMGNGAADVGSGADMGSDPGNNGSPDIGTSGGDDIGTSAMDDEDGGCGCTSAPGSSATPWFLALALIGARLRRRR